MGKALARHFSTICYLTVAMVVLYWTAIFAWFSSMAEPDEFTLAVPIFGIVAGLLGESGLLLAPWSLRRGSIAKLVVLVALLPPLAFLGHVLFEYVDLDGFVPQSKIQPPVVLSAFLVHAWALAKVSRTLPLLRSHAA